MQASMINKLREYVARMPLPAAQRTGSRARRYYEAGLDEVNSYSGDPITYFRSVTIFKETESCPYAYAGIAYVLAHASWDDDKADVAVLNEAMDWLEKAQEWEPDRVEINFIEAFIYIIGGELEHGRTVLDHLGRQNAQYFHYCVMEMLYWYYYKHASNYKKWFDKSMNAANTRLQGAYVLNLAGNYYLKLGRYELSIELFKDVVKLNPDDAWAWHNMSIMLLHLENYEDAELCNQKALSIMDFGAARQTEAKLQKYKKMSGGRLGRLFKR